MARTSIRTTLAGAGALVTVPLDRVLTGSASVLVGWDDQVGGTFFAGCGPQGRLPVGGCPQARWWSGGGGSPPVC